MALQLSDSLNLGRVHLVLKKQSEHSNWHVNAVTDHGEDGKGNLEKEILIQASLVKE